MTFGEKLSELLEERNMTQKEFAKTLNIAPTTLNGYIKDKRQPDFELVKKIASALSVSVDLLLGGEGFELTAKELSLITKLRTLSEDQQKMVYTLVSISAKERKQRDL
ncbi:MAG: helix-turn-helix transcriptional regulator [Ruminococcaceae bacterium]|nr:helix-turn-helix transcriptional regulator [Oscillospiraceae bacterium]